jgi:hypothetical protein
MRERVEVGKPIQGNVMSWINIVLCKKKTSIPRGIQPQAEIVTEHGQIP